MLILLTRNKDLERLNSLPRAVPLTGGRARDSCMLGLTSKPVFLTIGLLCLHSTLHIVIFPKPKFAHGIPLVKQSSPTFAYRVKFKFLVLADRSLPPSLYSSLFSLSRPILN